MVANRQQETVRLTPAQALCMERMGECLWPTEKLSAGEVTRRLALTQLLLAESERGMVDMTAGSWKRGNVSGEFATTFPHHCHFVT